MTHKLTWGNDHSLSLAKESDGLKVTLDLRKKGGWQILPIMLPSTVTLEMVLSAWEAQGENWDSLFVFEGPPYLACRAIWLPVGSLMWHLIHLNDAPNDTFGLTFLTRETWRKFAPFTLSLVQAI